MTTVVLSLFFSLTDANIARIRQLHVLWNSCESGAPAIDISEDESLADPLEQFLTTAKLDAGTYELRDGSSFTVTADHLALLANANIQGPFVDCKRPYGDMTYFEIDMARILGVEFTRDDKGRPRFTKEQLARFDRLHHEMQRVLQVFVEHATVR